jgi:hypothetical protein
MPRDGSERRRAVRREPEADEPLSRVRLRTGRELTVVNISASGALVEGLTRLLPNTHTDLHIVTRHGRVLVRTRVVRAHVWQLERDKVCYRTALAFDTAVDTAMDPAPSQAVSRERDSAESSGYALPAETRSLFGAPGTAYPALDADDRA